MCDRIRLWHPLYALDSSTMYKESMETKLILNRNIQSFPTYCVPILCTAALLFIDLFCMSLFLPRIHSVDIMTHSLVIVCYIVLTSKRLILLKWNSKYCLRCLGRYNSFVIVHSGQSFWLQIQRSRVRFPALPDFLSSSGSETGSTQPREVNWGATWINSSGSGPENRD